MAKGGSHRGPGASRGRKPPSDHLRASPSGRLKVKSTRRAPVPLDLGQTSGWALGPACPPSRARAVCVASGWPGQGAYLIQFLLEKPLDLLLLSLAVAEQLLHGTQQPGVLLLRGRAMSVRPPGRAPRPTCSPPGGHGGRHAPMRRLARPPSGPHPGT